MVFCAKIKPKLNRIHPKTRRKQGFLMMFFQFDGYLNFKNSTDLFVNFFLMFCHPGHLWSCESSGEGPIWHCAIATQNSETSIQFHLRSNVQSVSNVCGIPFLLFHIFWTLKWYSISINNTFWDVSHHGVFICTFSLLSSLLFTFQSSKFNYSSSSQCCWTRMAVQMSFSISKGTQKG